jgi:hypothetical protein
MVLLSEGFGMNRQQKFAEQGAYGERVGRTAYALDESALPEPAAGLRWHHIEDFDQATEVLDDPV